MTLDPLDRWREYGEKPDYAGLLTFAGLPYSEDPADLKGVDVAIVGAPTDDLVSDRPGARFAPRAIRAASCPPGPHLQTQIDGIGQLKIIDFGDAPVVPADPQRTKSNRAIFDTVAAVHKAGAVPIVLGGDHGVTLPQVEAAFKRFGPVGLIHFDTHTDTGSEVFGSTMSHGTPMRTMLERGLVDPNRYVQIGLRGYWPGPETFDWQRSLGVTSIFAHEVSSLGIERVIEQTIQIIGEQPAFLTIDVDVLDPAFAPGTGTPEPGGLTSAELLFAARKLAANCKLIGADVVEVIPTMVGSADITALVAERTVREIITGHAQYRAGQ